MVIINRLINDDTKCKKCANSIDDDLNRCEFMNCNYHIDCFCCNYCNRNLDIPINSNKEISDNLPFCDRYGNLYCVQHYIRYVELNIILNFYFITSI